MLKMADTATGPTAKQQKQHGVAKVLPDAVKADVLPRRNDAKAASMEARHSSSPNVPVSRKPKASSFQITSVTVGTRPNADNGEDSADDLDESHSHTDDNSRVTDHGNETPSFSEDTSFSKEDVFYSSNALGTAPVIPTSSQYGLAIVSPELNGTAALTDVHVSLSDTGINIVGNAKQQGDVESKEAQQRNERFKVVKIESTEPFKRGRWMCMDYLDHTTLQQATASSDGAIEGINDSAAKVNNILPGQTAPAVFYNSTVATVVTTGVLPEVAVLPAIATTAATVYTAQSMPSHQIQEAIATAAKRPPKMSARHHTPGQTQPVQTFTQSGRRHTTSQEYTQGATLPVHLLNFRDSVGLEASLANLKSTQPAEQHHTAPQVRRSDSVAAQTGPEAPSSQHHPVAEVDRVKEVIMVAEGPPVVCERVAPEVADSNCVSTSSGVNSPTVSVVSQPEMTPDATVAEVDVSPEPQQQHLSGATPANPDENPPNDDSENASGTSAVAIDNKIEQAMDLVKSHLMFAVREEVEVLKEKIAELMDRINQLEVENTILKANATQETLSQLSATMASGKVQSSTAGNGSVS
ncbi:protein bunched, class 2/F/G isoform [Phlebotomus argentipes]|uniref:protein bunched, class 2/F/G isoform n=1 Tax=Phlebotomus argentipes TaxID=94469 RepID=UPI002893248E|nr:protein bunched, class 2/F/G isoform [Phlebotomus argentipes]